MVKSLTGSALVPAGSLGSAGVVPGVSVPVETGVLNYHKNDAKNTSMPTQMIAGAQEYYDYTKELDEADAMALTAA